MTLDEKKAESIFAEKSKEDLAKFSIFVNSFRGQKNPLNPREGPRGEKSATIPVQKTCYSLTSRDADVFGLEAPLGIAGVSASTIFPRYDGSSTPAMEATS